MPQVAQRGCKASVLGDTKNHLDMALDSRLYVTLLELGV